MNYLQMITLLQVGYTTVEVTFVNKERKFAEAPKTYVYKTREKLAPGDVVVVDTPSNGLTCCTVVNVHPAPEIDPKAPFSYKWIVQKVDRTLYDEHCFKEQQAVALLEKAEREKARQEMVGKLKESLPTDPALRAQLDAIFTEITGGSVKLLE